MSKTFNDISLFLLILSNIISIIFAYVQGWAAQEVFWIYWGQSVGIGIINFIRIRNLKEFSTENFKMGNSRPPETEETKNQVSWFFLLHYGCFHVGYFIFLLVDYPLSLLSGDKFIFIIILIAAFFMTHRFSYAHNIKTDFKGKKPNIGTLMFYPYLRIIPMHLSIIIGGLLGTAGGLLFFMVLKTFADAGMHMIEHHIFRKK